MSYYHHQIRSMNYYPLFRVRSCSNGVRCMSFHILSFFWIWTPGLAFGISVPSTTNALHSNPWVSPYKLWNLCSWSESMRNLELKWPCICTSGPNSNVLTHEVFRPAYLIGQYMWYFQQIHDGSKWRGKVFHLWKGVDSSWNLIQWTVIWIWCYNGYDVALDINLGINTIISRLLTFALLHTKKAIYPLTKRDEEVFFV